MGGMSNPTDTPAQLPADATDAEREAFAAAHRERYLAAKAAREAAKTAKLTAMLDRLAADTDWSALR